MNTARVEWLIVLEGLEEALEDILSNLRIARKEEIPPDIIALELFDILDRYLGSIKKDLGVL